MKTEKVLNTGPRERQALMRWWDVRDDYFHLHARYEDGKSWMPFWRALELAVYDSDTDTITWQGMTKTVGECQAMVRPS